MDRLTGGDAMKTHTFSVTLEDGAIISIEVPLDVMHPGLSNEPEAFQEAMIQLYEQDFRPNGPIGAFLHQAAVLCEALIMTPSGRLSGESKILMGCLAAGAQYIVDKNSARSAAPADPSNFSC